MSETTKLGERIPTHIAESYAGKGVVHGEWRDVVRDLATDLVDARCSVEMERERDSARLAHAAAIEQVRGAMSRADADRERADVAERNLEAARAQLVARPDPVALVKAALSSTSTAAARAVRRYFQSGDEKMGDHCARIVAVEVDATDVNAIIEAATKGTP